MTIKSGWWVIAQGLAVVVGILLAFGIEAWYSNQQQRDDEVVMLKSLLGNFQRMQSILDTDLVFNEAVLDSTKRLINYPTVPEQAADESEIDRLIADTWFYNGGDKWNSAALTALIDGGGLETISNPELRQLLADAYERIGTLQALYAVEIAFQHNVLVPYLIKNANLSQLANSISHLPGRPDSAYEYPQLNPRVTTSHSQLLKSLEFQNLLVARMDKQLDILQFGFPGLDQMLEVVVSGIEEELAN